MGGGIHPLIISIEVPYSSFAIREQPILPVLCL